MTSIIIPTYNAGDQIRALLLALKSQTIACEIIVVDSSSTDGTAEKAKQGGARVIRIEKADFDHGATRNRAVRSAGGEILLFLTQDAFPVNEHLVANLTGPLRHRDIPLSYGRQTAGPGAGPLEIFARRFNYPEEATVKAADDEVRLGIKTFFCSNVCSAVRRLEFEEVGGFPEKIIMNEDMALAAKIIRAGYRVAYEPSAVVRHFHDYSLAQQFRRYFDIGVALNQAGLGTGANRAEGQGLKYLQKQTIYLLREKEWLWIPYGFVEALVKYCAFRLGLREKRLPDRLKVRLSMHQDFWRR
jgi:rhamnosyltransferase